MNNILQIKSFCRRVKSAFEKAVIKFEYRNQNDTYIIDIAPIDIYNSPEYIAMEEDFRTVFEEQNEYSSLIFVSEDSIIRANDSKLEFKIEGCTSTINIQKPIFGFSKENMVCYDHTLINEFALAA